MSLKPYTPKRYISVTDTAKLIRADLKKAHPAVKFSVKSSKYAGGASVDIFWTDGPVASVVDALLKGYVGTKFDGSDDSTTYLEGEFKRPDGTIEQVQYGSNYVSTHRNISDIENKVKEVVTVLGPILATNGVVSSTPDIETFAYRVVRSRNEGEPIITAIERVLENPRTSC